MIFSGFGANDYSVQLGFTNSDSENDRLQYIGYLDGGFDVLDFGARSYEKSKLDLSAIPKTDYADLLAYLLENVGNEITVEDTSDVFAVGDTGSNTYSVFVETVVPKDEQQFAETGYYEISLTIRRPVASTVKREFLVEIDLNAFSVDLQVDTIGDLPAATEGTTALVLTPRTLYVYESGNWEETFPLKPYEVTFYVSTLDDIVGRPQENNTAFTTSDGEYYTFDGDDWVATVYPPLSPWKPVVNNDPSIGLQNGILRWSAFDDGVYDGEDFVAGFIAQKGIKFPTKSAPFDKGYGIEVLDGFSVKINNAERFSLRNVEFNFFGAVCTLSVYMDGVGVIKERTGLNKTNSFDPGFFELSVEPFLWLDDDKNVVQTTFSEIDGNGKQGVPNIYGSWQYAPLIKKNDELVFFEDAAGFTGWTIYDVADFDPVAETTKFRFERPEAGFVLPTVNNLNPDWFAVLSTDSNVFYPVSVSYETPTAGAPFGYVVVEIETFAPLEELQPGVLFRALLFDVEFVTDFEATAGIAEPLEIFTYNEETDTYEATPNGLFEKVDEQTLRLVSNPEFIVVNGDEILFAQFFKADRISFAYYAAKVGELITGAPFSGARYTLTNSTGVPDFSNETELLVYEYESAGNDGVMFLRDRPSVSWNNLFFKFPNTQGFRENGYIGSNPSNLSLSTIFYRSFKNVTPEPGAVAGLGFDAVAKGWYVDNSGLDSSGVVVGFEGGAQLPTLDFARYRAGFDITFYNQSGLFFQEDKTILPQTNTARALGNVFSWDITNEIKSQLIGATEVRFLSAFAVYGFAQEASDTLSGTLGLAKNTGGRGGNQKPRRGWYANVTAEIWLRHRTTPALDRLVKTIEKTTSNEGSGAKDYFRNGIGDQNGLIGTYPRNYLPGRVAGFSINDRVGGTDNSVKIHQFCNLPGSLGGDDKFYTSDEDFVSNEFWLLFLLNDSGTPAGGVVAAELIGETVSNTADNTREVSGTIIDATILDINGKAYANNADIPERLKQVADPAANGGGWLAIKIFSLDDIANWVVRANGLGQNEWEFSKYESAIVTTNPFHDGYNEFAYAGRDLFLFDQNVVDELFGADDYKFDEYERIDVVNYLWRTRENNNVEKDLPAWVQTGAYPRNVLAVPGSQRSDYSSKPMDAFFEVSREYDSDETYYVRAEGRVDENGNAINNPRTIAEDQIRNVVPNFQIGFNDSYSERERWLARSFLQGEKSVRQVLEDLTRHTHAVLTYDAGGGLSLSSAYIGDYNGFAKAAFTPANVSVDSKNKVKYRDITKIYSDFTFGFNFNAGKGETDRELRIKLSEDDASLSVQGLEANNGDSQALRDLKTTLRNQLNGYLLEDFQIAKTFYNTGKSNAWADTVDQYYDNNIPTTNENGVEIYGVQSIVALAWRWIRSNILNSWQITFKTSMDYVLFNNNVNDDNRLKLGDPISYTVPAITGDLVLFGLVSRIKPDYYNGKVEITVYSNVDPFIYATLYDRIWDGRDVDAITYDRDNYVLKPLFKYPFKDPNQYFTYPDGGDVDDGGFDVNDSQFTNDTFADPEDPFEPF